MQVDATSQKVLLEGLSRHQRSLVERHLPLVQLTLGRSRHLCRGSQVGREPRELFQEGCLALVDAVRSHDPSRHCNFAAYAMARIRNAMSRHVHETADAIRVPYITQRRHRERQRTARKNDRHRPDGPPRVRRECEVHTRMCDRPHDPGTAPQGNEVTIGDLLRERYDAAARRVLGSMNESARHRPDHTRVVRRIARERWQVPEPVARASVRQLARELDCSVGRITHFEARFRRLVADTLSNDATYGELMRMGRRRETGLRESLDHEEVARLRALAGDTA